ARTRELSRQERLGAGSSVWGPRRSGVSPRVLQRGGATGRLQGVLRAIAVAIRSTSMKTEQKPPTLQPNPREPLTFNDLVEPGASTCGNIRWRRRTTMNRTPRAMALAAVCLTLGVPAIAGTRRESCDRF